MVTPFYENKIHFLFLINEYLHGEFVDILLLY